MSSTKSCSRTLSSGCGTGARLHAHVSAAVARRSCSRSERSGASFCTSFRVTRKLDWRAVLSRVRWSFTQPYDEPPERFVADRVDAVHAATGDPVQDALIDAVAAVIARVGLERATGSRIARRANLTSGAIYGRYTTKEDLLDQAIVTLLANRFTDDLMANSYTFTAADPGSATARIVGGYLSQPREQWRRFRIETQLAARHHPRIAATVNRVQEDALREYLEALGAHTPEARRRARHPRPLRTPHPNRPRLRRPRPPRTANNRLAPRPSPAALPKPDHVTIGI